MVKCYNLRRFYIDFNDYIDYFYIRLSNDINGCPRYKVWIIDCESEKVYETILKGYKGIEETVSDYIEEVRQ